MLISIIIIQKVVKVLKCIYNIILYFLYSSLIFKAILEVLHRLYCLFFFNEFQLEDFIFLILRGLFFVLFLKDLIQLWEEELQFFNLHLQSFLQGQIKYFIIHLPISSFSLTHLQSFQLVFLIFFFSLQLDYFIPSSFLRNFETISFIVFIRVVKLQIISF